MSRAARTLVVAAVVLAVPAAACTVLLGSKDVPTPDDASGDATVDGKTDGGSDATGDAPPPESGGDSGATDAGSDVVAEACAPTSARCEGLQPQVCGANGQWHDAGAPCEYVCDDGGCTGQCMPTSKQCVGLDPETCTSDGLWEAGAACPFLCDADAGSCVGSCAPNTVQCGTVPAGDGGSTASVNTCDSKGQLHSAPCGQPTPDCSEAGAPACACTGSMCSSSVCAHLQTDPGNCGVCGHDCLGGGCVGGVCQPFALVSNQGGPYDIAIDTVNAYWVDVAGGTVNECALTGCNNSPTVLASGQSSPTGIAVDATTVYWVNIGTIAPNSGSVMSCPIAGCAGAPASVATGQSAPTAIAIAANGNAYWTGSSGTMKCSAASCVTPTAFGPGGSDIVVDGTNAYWTATGGPVRCALGGCGGNPTAIATNQFGPWAITVDSTNVYWTTLSGGITIDSCVFAVGCGGNPMQYSGATRPYDVAVDATDVYWVDFTADTVSRCPLGGCPGAPPKATVIASGQSSPAALAVDNTAIYWVNDANPGAVMKLAK